MHRAIEIIGLILLLTVSFIPSAAYAQQGGEKTAKTPGEIAREQSQSVVVIEALDDRDVIVGQGSGFIVTSNGAIVSNLHVVRGATQVRVKLPSGDVYQTSDIVDVDESKDIVILKIKGFQLPVIKLGDSDRTEIGDSIIAISSPEGLINSISTGVISGVRRLDTHRVFQITAPISNGSSGGALFSSSGEVIGIVTYLFKSGQNINFAVPINYARGMIGDQVTTALSRLQPPPVEKEPTPAATGIGESISTGDELDAQLAGASRGKRGRTQQEPMFLRPDEALAFFYRLVDGLGLYSTTDVDELTRTAAVIKSKETDATEEFTIKYLSFYSGLSMSFGKPDRLLTSVELLVNWSIDDLKNTFGDKFKKKVVDNRQVLDFGKLQTGKQLIALLDGNGNIRSVRFTKMK